MHIFAILFPVFIFLALAGIFADLIAPKHPALENLIYDLLDKIM